MISLLLRASISQLAVITGPRNPCLPVLKGTEDPDASKVSASPPLPGLWQRSARSGVVLLFLLVVVMSVVLVIVVLFCGHHCGCSHGDDKRQHRGSPWP